MKKFLFLISVILIFSWTSCKDTQENYTPKKPLYRSYPYNQYGYQKEDKYIQPITEKILETLGDEAELNDEGEVSDKEEVSEETENSEESGTIDNSSTTDSNDEAVDSGDSTSSDEATVSEDNSTEDTTAGDTSDSSTEDSSNSSSEEVASDCPTNSPPYPIVLAHGFSGFANIGPITYFRGVKKYLTKKGIEVYTPAVKPYAGIAERAEELFEQIKAIGKKVNIIAHSMGGLDARFIASPNGMDKGCWIGAIVTVSTPHHGSEVADFVLDVVPEEGEDAVSWLSELLGLGNLEESLENLSTDYVNNIFNPYIIDNSNVAYYSISAYQKPFRGLNPILFPTYEIIKAYGGSSKNDGMVSESSGRWGNHLGVIKADHADQIGYMTFFNHKKFYYNIVKFLRKQGY